MNHKLPYEEGLSEKLKNIPLPDEDMAWEEMKQLLEEEDDDAIIVPPPYRYGCGWALLLIILIAAICLVYFKTSFFSSKNGKPVQSSSTVQRNVSIDTAKNARHYLPDTAGSSDAFKPDSISLMTLDSFEEEKNKAFERKHAASAGAQRFAANIFPGTAEGATEEQTGKNKTSKRKKQPNKATGKSRVNISAPAPEAATNDPEKTLSENKNIFVKDTAAPADTIFKKVLSLKEKDTAAVPEKKADTALAGKKKEEKPKRKFAFAAGIALQQPVPLNGESSVAYHYYGRKSGLTEYIPSVYIRFYKEQKWFIHSAFKYGMPQQIKTFVYKEEVLDTARAHFKAIYFFMKKTYYHQVPLSFHYFVVPNLSIGTGIIYNKFVAAIASEDLRKGYPAYGPDTVITSKTFVEKSDSNFTRNNVAWLAELQYRWRRFSIGARYTMDLQPYVRYADALTGMPLSKRNYTFNFFLYYELWNSNRRRR